MTQDAENHTIELLRRLRADQSARFDRIDSTLAEVLTQMRIRTSQALCIRKISPAARLRNWKAALTALRSV
ncbi:MAG: hypothetical protein EKK41_08995 [Hyphomicrobiales bacterium]|nr:MAG: hypothetical protein EKK41_08995 [Hyphomicrobiales bacterium]